ncbi:MAG: ABC transporter permease, partial [Pseudomonadota bacterium]
MSRFGTILATLATHWRRRPGQLATLLTGLALATALWSGVQALNQQARESYDRAASALSGIELPMLLPAEGAAMPETVFVELRRAGWPVSPLLEGAVEIRGEPLRLLGVEPVSLPGGAGFAIFAPGGEEEPAAFFRPPGRTLAAPETIAAMGARPGDRPEGPAAPLPPLSPRADLAPGLLILDIG